MNQIIRSVPLPLAAAAAPPLLLLLIQLAPPRAAASAAESSVRVELPQRYTAMEGDLEVRFELLMPNAFSHNAIVGLEYLAGDSILPAEGSRRAASPKKLASLPVPLGLREGTVVFQCGTVKHAGPHRAFVTVNGERRAESVILQGRFHQSIRNTTVYHEERKGLVITTSPFSRFFERQG